MTDLPVPPKPALAARRWTVSPIRLKAYLFAVVAVGVAIPIAHGASLLLPHANLSLVFLCAVLVVAATTGLGPALAAALLSFLAFNYFFIAPELTLVVDDEGDLATLAFFLLMATVTGNLAARMRREMDRNQATVTRLADLHLSGQCMLSAIESEQVIDALFEHISAPGKPVVFLPSPVLGDKLGEPSRGDSASVSSAEEAWAAEASARSTPFYCAGLAWYRLASPRQTFGLVGVLPEAVSTDTHELLNSLCDQAALALERILIARHLSEATVKSETEQLRSALLSSVSHDLRTPLASIIGAVTSLQDYGDSFSAEDRHELLATVHGEARRLDRYIQNLLDMTKLGQGPLALQRDWVDVRDLVGAAVGRFKRYGEHQTAIEVESARDLPLIWVHGALVEQALLNLLDNAARFSPLQAPVRIVASRFADAISIRVYDQGPGIAPEEREKVFDMFFTARQGDRSSRQGTGLGLAICRGLIAAHGGTVSAHEGASGKGTCMEIILPLGDSESPE